MSRELGGPHEPERPPRIGISCDWERTTDRRGAPAARFHLGAPYVDAVNAAGGLALLLPHQPEALADACLQGCQGLVLSGGDFDVPPDYYGQTPQPGLGQVYPERSSFERALLRLALATQLPVLGICGGMQLLNVVCGGSLHQDQAHRRHSLEHQQPEDKRLPYHPVQLQAGSRLARLLGGNQVQANSTHHQLVDAVGAGLQAVGHAPDGVVEAIEAPGDAFVLGVQWHPECLLSGAHQPLYDGLVAAARLWGAGA